MKNNNKVNYLYFPEKEKPAEKQFETKCLLLFTQSCLGIILCFVIPCSILHEERSCHQPG